MTASGLASQPCRSDLQTLQTRFSPIPLTWLPTSPLCSLAGPAPRLPLPLSFLTLLFLSCLSPSHWWLLESPRLCPQLTPRWYLTDVSADQPLLPWPWSPTQAPVYSKEAEEPGWSEMQAAPCLPGGSFSSLQTPFSLTVIQVHVPLPPSHIHSVQIKFIIHLRKTKPGG